MKNGFFVPASISENYVSNKKTADGSNVWDKATGEATLGKQAALQTVNKEYSNTINNAYSNYLLANRGIRGSDMGEGYKEAYIEATKAQLMNQAAETNLTAANLRVEIGEAINKQLIGVRGAYETEVANMDRVYSSANDYLSYLKTLGKSTDLTSKYLTADQESLTIDDLYDTVFQAQPKDYLDEKGNIALSYIEWVNAQLKDTEADTSWSRWFLQGGFNQAKIAVKKGVKK